MSEPTPLKLCIDCTHIRKRTMDGYPRCARKIESLDPVLGVHRLPTCAGERRMAMAILDSCGPQAKHFEPARRPITLRVLLDWVKHALGLKGTE